MLFVGCSVSQGEILQSVSLQIEYSHAPRSIASDHKGQPLTKVVLTCSYMAFLPPELSASHTRHKGFLEGFLQYPALCITVTPKRPGSLSVHI